MKLTSSDLFLPLATAPLVQGLVPTKKNLKLAHQIMKHRRKVSRRAKIVLKSNQGGSS